MLFDVASKLLIFSPRKDSEEGQAARKVRQQRSHSKVSQTAKKVRLLEISDKKEGQTVRKVSQQRRTDS